VREDAQGPFELTVTVDAGPFSPEKESVFQLKVK
jgi:hypothetical protein